MPRATENPPAPPSCEDLGLAVGTRVRVVRKRGGREYGAGADDGPRERIGTIEGIFPRYLVVKADAGYRLTIQAHDIAIGAVGIEVLAVPRKEEGMADHTLQEYLNLVKAHKSEDDICKSWLIDTAMLDSWKKDWNLPIGPRTGRGLTLTEEGIQKVAAALQSDTPALAEAETVWMKDCGLTQKEWLIKHLSLDDYQAMKAANVSDKDIQSRLHVSSAGFGEWKVSMSSVTTPSRSMMDEAAKENLAPKPIEQPQQEVSELAVGDQAYWPTVTPASQAFVVQWGRQAIDEALASIREAVKALTERVAEVERRWQVHESIMVDRGLLDVLHPVNVGQLAGTMESLAAAMGADLRDIRQEFDRFKQQWSDNHESLYGRLSATERNIGSIHGQLNAVEAIHKRHRHMVINGLYSGKAED